MAKVARYRRLVISTVMGGQLFKSLGRSLFGLTLREARAGDRHVPLVFNSNPDAADSLLRICIIRGCSVPVAVREMSCSYKIIGECYVQGMMDGEAMDLGRACQPIRTEWIKAILLKWNRRGIDVSGKVRQGHL